MAKQAFFLLSHKMCGHKQGSSGHPEVDFNLIPVEVILLILVAKRTRPSGFVFGWVYFIIFKTGSLFPGSVKIGLLFYARDLLRTNSGSHAGEKGHTNSSTPGEQP